MTNPRRVQRALADIHLIAETIQTRIPQTEASLPFIATPSATNTRVGGGDISKPVEAAVMANTSLVEATWGDCWRHLADAITSLHAANRILGHRISQAQEGKLEERSNVASCDACERVVTMTPDDRLRSGYCTACYRAWDRAGRPDRTGFERGRRGIDTTARQVTINIAGIDHTLTQDQAERLGPNPTPETIAAIKQEITG